MSRLGGEETDNEDSVSGLPHLVRSSHSPAKEDLKLVPLGSGTLSPAQQAGLRVAVIESRFVGAGTSGRTTGKVSLLQGSTLTAIRKSDSAEVTRAYLEGNRERQAWLRRYLDEAGVPYQIKDAYTYAVDRANHGTLDAEATASDEAGLPLTMLGNNQVPLSFPVAGALKLDQQIQVDPIDVLAELCRDFRARGGKIFERTRMVSVDNTPVMKISTSPGD